MVESQTPALNRQSKQRLTRSFPPQLLKVSIRAALEAVTDLKPVGDDFNWTFKIKCQSCHEEHPKWVGIDATEVQELQGSRGEANFVWKCTLCAKQSSINFDKSLDRSKAVYTLEQSENQQYGAMAVLECRGCEIVAFDPKGAWTCKGAESGSAFDEFELSLDEPEWTDYDEKANAGVSVMDFESKIERA